MLNKTILMGRTTKELELKDAGSTKVVNATLAVPRVRKVEGQPDTDFIDFTVFGKSAEAMAKHVTKGTQIVIVGRLQRDSYTDKDGKSRATTKVMVEEWHFAGNKVTAAAAEDPIADDDEIPFA